MAAVDRVRILVVGDAGKGLFTRSDPKVYHCAYGEVPSDGQNGFHTHSARQTASHHWHNET